jgi:hypothetical protein
MRIIRTTNPNGTYRYEIDGKVQTKASKVLYTHATSYSVGDDTNNPVMMHKSEAAAGRAKGYPRLGWVKLGVHVIEDGDATATVAQHALTIANLAAVLMEQGRLRVSTRLSSAAITTTLDIARGRENTRAAGIALAHGHDRDIREAFKTSVPPAMAPVDQASACTHCATHPGWAHGDTTRRQEPRDTCGVCLGSGVPQPPAKRRAPRNGTRVRVNTEYPGQAYKGMTGKVHSKRTGDDGVRYVMVDFKGITWPFQIHELDVI